MTKAHLLPVGPALYIAAAKGTRMPTVKQDVALVLTAPAVSLVRSLWIRLT
jgi:hypothetical protein